MASYSTPGSYIEEISKLPASIAPVATAIPAFIGYTKDGGVSVNPPVRITSMLEYEEKFGGAYPELFQVKLEDNDQITIENLGSISSYVLYYQLQMYFSNGGGPCYIVSVGDYTLSIDKDKLIDGLNACQQEDEITLLCVPEAIFLVPSLRAEINNKMLDQCALLKDRFAVMDVFTDDNAISVKDDGDDFRNEVGANNLKYGGAYYPALKTSIGYHFVDSEILIDDDRTGNLYDTKKLSDIRDGILGTGSNAKYLVNFTSFNDTDELVIEGDIYIVDSSAAPAPADMNSFVDVADLVTKLTINGFSISGIGTTLTIDSDIIGELTPGLSISFNDISISGSPPPTITPDDGTNVISINKSLHNQIKKELSKQKVTLHPCGAIAGIYAGVDRTRGVWKAPANVSLNRVIAPAKLITHEDQETLNIDATSGKSINAIRAFSGKGILVWGARTLAGNDNEWRYVSTRRLFIFMEESIQKATEFVVFEPNDANTWNRVKGMIENFLTSLWREGALAGAKPEDAFFVNIGLGVTMSSQDILDGIMNVEIGVAAVRPAEFIILKFSHKLQES